MTHNTINVAGIDTGKAKLDIALSPGGQELQVDNTPDGHVALAAWLTVEVSARLHRELVAYATALNGGDTKGAPTPERLIPPMIERFIATDRSYAKARRTIQPG